MSYEFDLRAVEADPSGYYLPRWGLAHRITCTADTLKEATAKAAVVLGETATSGWVWRYACDSIREVTL